MTEQLKTGVSRRNRESWQVWYWYWLGWYNLWCLKLGSLNYPFLIAVQGRYYIMHLFSRKYVPTATLVLLFVLVNFFKILFLIFCFWYFQIYIDSGIKLDNNKYNQKLPHIYFVTKWMANKYFFCHKIYIFDFHLLEAILKNGFQQVKAKYIDFTTKK